jgi:hypothetical protein
MMENGKKPGISISPTARMRASGPILILAILFVVAVFLSWYFTWFGRGLSDSEISQYLADDRHPRHVQHALLQIQERMEKGDGAVRQWYPRILELAVSPETEFRLTVAWLMGSDNQSNEFHQALLKLIRDPEPLVRRNAALALLRFQDSNGRPELLAILEPYSLSTPLQGRVVSTLREGSPLARATMVARIQSADGSVHEIRSPLPGKIDKIMAANGANVSPGDQLLTITSDEESIWEALRGLALAGQNEDVSLVEGYARPEADVSEKIRAQAKLTANAIRARHEKK